MLKPAATIRSGYACMRCPKCGCQNDRVIDSRASREGATIRRRRECIACGFRFTTYEEVEQAGLMVLKRDDRREEFSKEKLMSGIKKACQKRRSARRSSKTWSSALSMKSPTSTSAKSPPNSSAKLVMEGLRAIDEVAYVRFASVYRRFQEATDFVHEVKKLGGKP